MYISTLFDKIYSVLNTIWNADLTMSQLPKNFNSNLPGGWQSVVPARPIPSFKLERLHEEETFSPQDLYGQRTILVFLPGVWVPWSRKFLNEINEINKDLASVNCRLVTIISQRTSQLQAYFITNPVEFDVLADPYGVANLRFGIFEDNVMQPMRISKPTVFGLNAEAKVEFRFSGLHLNDRPKLEDILQISSYLSGLPQKKRWWPTLLRFGRGLPRPVTYVRA